MRKSCLLFVFLLLAIFALKLISGDSEEKLEKQASSELIADSEKVELANN